MPGILYVVATPIGNLEDVTLRALRVLREVTLIAAEDTRRTARLLQHYSIPTPTTSLHEHNERAKTPGLIERLTRGEAIAVVTDAGTPVLSDPGAVLVAAAHQAGVRVEPIPGPSAALAALSASGVLTDGFIVAGFPPFRSVARKKWLGEFATDRRAVVLFEAPHRIRALLADMLLVLGDRIVTLARELTKAHEELVNRPITAHLQALERPRGELTLVVHPNNSPAIRPAGVLAPEAIRAEFGELTKSGEVGRREALRTLADRYGRSVRELYALLERAKK